MASSQFVGQFQMDTISQLVQDKWADIQDLDIPWEKVQDWQSWAPYAAAVFPVYWFFLAFYRVYLSPLSKIPGPKLAAMTYLYENYYEAWLGGKYFLRVAEMHKKYGPVVRITPDEIHFTDAEFLDTLYPVGGRKTDKADWIRLRTGTPYSIVSTGPHDLHRLRRNAIAPFFSTASIHRLEDIMHEHLSKMLTRLDGSGKTGEIIQLHNVFKACASDVITKYAFDDNLHFMDMADYGQAHFASTDSFFYMTHWCLLFPWLMPMIQFTPDWLAKILFPDIAVLRERQNWWLNQVRSIRNSPNPEKVKKTIFESILASGKLPEVEKTDLRLASEAQLTVFAGEGTTAWTLTACVYQLLANPHEIKKLKNELKSVKFGPNGIPALADVEALPYLNAIIMEAVRLHPGVMARQTRISPEEPIVYSDKSTGKSYTLPAGTPFSASPLDTHTNEAAFKDAYAYKPQRWIDDPKGVSRKFHGFARGSRNCVGMSLAKREMALILSSMFNRYAFYEGQKGPSMELWDTIRSRDIDANRDFIIPVAADGSKGLQVKFRF